MKGGITHLFGPKSTGKSPIQWAWAQAIGGPEGEDWLGLPVQKGRVLIIEVDQPIATVQKRVQGIEKRDGNVWFMSGPPMNVPNLDPETAIELDRVRKEVKPDVVFFNTLRNMTTLELETGTTCRIMYGWGRDMFPGCALVYIHHPKKTPPSNVHVNEDEMFSGSNAWRNDAQVALHLKPKREKRHNKWYTTAVLRHTGAQASALYNDLPLLLKNGSVWSSPLADELRAIQKLAFDEDLSGNALDKAVAMAHIVGSVSTARNRRLLLEAGFPGTPNWLGTKNAEGDEEEGEDAQDQ